MEDQKISKIIGMVALGALGLVTFISIGWGMSAINRVYDVWAQHKEGEAELAKAESNRRIKVLEAHAIEESAKSLAQAEVIRARGVAEANQIIGASLKENEGYLRYLWITGLDHSNHQVIYVPTEANLPILEAGKR